MVSDGLVWVTATWIYQYFTINRRVIKVSKRLEEIKDRVLIDKVYYEFNGSKGRWGKVYTLSDEDYRYLMQQAERVQELEEFKLKVEKMYKYIHINAKKSVAEKEKLEQQNKRYREALELIKLKTLDIKENKDTRPFQIYGIASEALEGEE